MKKLPILFFLVTMVSCGTGKETAEVLEEPDTLAEQHYVEEETGRDPEGMPCGLKGFKDTAHTIYRKKDLLITITIGCPDQVPLPVDETEASLVNTRDQDNRVVIAMKGKDYDTSFVLLKKYFTDSLGHEYMSQHVFGNTSFETLSGKEDFVFTTFIGRAYSDDGLVVKFSVNRKKGIRVLSTAYPEMGMEAEPGPEE